MLCKGMASFLTDGHSSDAEDKEDGDEVQYFVVQCTIISNAQLKRMKSLLLPTITTVVLLHDLPATILFRDLIDEWALEPTIKICPSWSDVHRRSDELFALQNPLLFNTGWLEGYSAELWTHAKECAIYGKVGCSECHSRHITIAPDQLPKCLKVGCGVHHKFVISRSMFLMRVETCNHLCGARKFNCSSDE